MKLLRLDERAPGSWRVIYHSNGVLLGDIEQGVDGNWLFWPMTTIGLTQAVLAEIVQALDEANA